MTDETLWVTNSRRIAEDTTEIDFQLDCDVDLRPGQFAHIAVEGAFLRRPISISGHDCGRRTIRFIVQALGAGSRWLTGLPRGARTRALLPLGNPFPMEVAEQTLQERGKVWLVGGGIGLAPLLFVARHLKERSFRVDSFAGFRDEKHAFGMSELAECGETMFSAGGFVTDQLKEAIITKGKPDLIFACGPRPMVRALGDICLPNEIRTYISLEERMACGLGACLVCNCGIRTPSGVFYRRVCKDGPVFDLEEVAI